MDCGGIMGGSRGNLRLGKNMVLQQRRAMPPDNRISQEVINPFPCPASPQSSSGLVLGGAGFAWGQRGSKGYLAGSGQMHG
jgi:hypothetical protein